MQEQAFRQVAGMQVPAGVWYWQSMFAGAGGMGAADIAATGCWCWCKDYYGMATSPYAQQAFMSPYMQNVVDVQKARSYP